MDEVEKARTRAQACVFREERKRDRKDRNVFTQANSETVAEAKARHKENYETAIRAARGGSLPRPFIKSALRKKQAR